MSLLVSAMNTLLSGHRSGKQRWGEPYRDVAVCLLRSFDEQLRIEEVDIYKLWPGASPILSFLANMYRTVYPVRLYE